ncbi:Nuclear receptor sub 2 group C member 2 [Mortierella claussenii]|nr:Nuclear receptor sub 2 group C member 2 [Mortierella claussenii]
MTVAVPPADPEIAIILQQTTQHIPFEDISRLIFNTFVPGRFGKIHTGRWKDQDVELRQPVGDNASIEKEVRLLDKLRHCPQILHLHGYTIEPSTSTPYLVLQHYEHGSLHSYLVNFHPHLTWSDRYNLAMDIALGLRYLHHKGCKHRHLHSASILIDTNGSAVLSDFGSSRDSEVISSREHINRMTYLAPERLSKSGSRYSAECDIYSLGMVFWEISSGRPPFEDLLTPQNIQQGALTSLAQNIVAGRRERTVKGIDPVFENLYTRCWDPNPSERPSINWIIQMLGALLKQPPSALFRQMEELGIDDEPVVPPLPPKSPKPSNGRSMTIKVGKPTSEAEFGAPSPLLRSRELLLSPREPDYPPPPPPVPPPIPPVPQRRKLSAAPSFTPSLRSMSVSSSSSSGSSTSTVPAVPTRDTRRVSTMHHSAEIPQYNVLPKRRSPQTIWEACQEGNADLAEWYILTTGAGPDDLVSLPAYSMLAEVAPIHVACFYQPETLMDVLKILQRNGANMQLYTTLTNQSALHIVLEHATNYNLALETAKYLMLECKLSVNDPDNRGLTPFHKYLKNPHLSGIVSVAGSELYTLLREKGEANLSMESLHEGNALGMAVRYLRVDLMKLFLLTDLSCSEPRSLAFAASVVEAPLSESRNSKMAQDMCRATLAEWKGERGETKRMVMAERILEHQGLTASAPSSMASSPSLASSSVLPNTSFKGKKQGGLLGLGKSSKASREELSPAAAAPLPPKVAAEVDVAKKILQSTAVKQRKLKNLIADSGF